MSTDVHVCLNSRDGHSTLLPRIHLASRISLLTTLFWPPPSTRRHPIRERARVHRRHHSSQGQRPPHFLYRVGMQNVTQEMWAKSAVLANGPMQSVWPVIPFHVHHSASPHIPHIFRDVEPVGCQISDHNGEILPPGKECQKVC